jgi:hypothetical protein
MASDAPTQTILEDNDDNDDDINNFVFQIALQILHSSLTYII